MKPKQVYYYSDERRDEFSGITRDTIQIDEHYRYRHTTILWNVVSWFLYRMIMTPVAYCYMKYKFHMKVVNRKILKQCKKEGYFLYGNHTQVPGDGYISMTLTFPKRGYVVVNADNISLKGTRMFMELLGACPIPSNIKGMKNFVRGLKLWADKKQSIVIYPEAHIWPYYTGIRPFTDASFAYPVMFAKPVYCFTVTYQKRKNSMKPNITIYVDGPFRPDATLKLKDAKAKLHKVVYHTMKERSKNSTYAYVTYQRKEDE